VASPSRRACVLTRDALHYRKSCFEHGLRVNGYAIKSYVSDPHSGDLLVIWNRSFRGQEDAERFERGGATVLVAENGLLGKGWLGGNWYSLALHEVAGAGGDFPDGGGSRWDGLGVSLAPWRTAGTETVILGQRGIGSRTVKSPPDWAEKTQARIGGRVRKHPGKHNEGPPLADDLARAAAVVTWASSAALQALAMGVPVWHEHPAWVGRGASRRLQDWGEVPALRDDELRLALFRRLAWAMWRIEEIDSGAAFRHLLEMT
jgi:hypothetical protein